MNDDLKSRIENHINTNKVFLFMKGTPESPMCGFSAQASAIITELGVEYGTFNVLEDEAIRQGIKEYADWPTIPQLYVDGEFIGGCDIMTEMFQSGELAQAVGK